MRRFAHGTPHHRDTGRRRIRLHPYECDFHHRRTDIPRNGLVQPSFRPAINVGISVSRVGGSAQIKSMKKVAGTLKIDQAQYRELEAFSKFSNDMDSVTVMTIDRGRKNNQLLIQPQYSPMPVGEQVAILYCGTHGLMRDIRIDQVIAFQHEFLESLRASHRQDVLEVLEAGTINEQVTKVIEEVAQSTLLLFKN